MLGFPYSAIPSSRMTEAEYRPGHSGGCLRGVKKQRHKPSTPQKLARHTDDDPSAENRAEGGRKRGVNHARDESGRSA
jgi:hypothetical protein